MLRQLCCRRWSWQPAASNVAKVGFGGRALAAAAAAAGRLPLERLQQAITPDVCHELATQGFAVVDGVFGCDAAQQLKAELVSLHAAGLMHVNTTHLVQHGQTRLLPKSHIHEAELSFDPRVKQAAPLVAQLDADRSLATLLSLFMPKLRLESHAIKLQYNVGGGGCFPLHFDSDDRLDGRRVTAIFYLNDAWSPTVGGQLRLYPFPAPPVDIAPLMDRLVLFSTTRMLHRVLPSRLPRCCFTIWLSEGAKPKAAAAAAAVPPPDPGSAGAAGGDELWRFLMQPAVRQHVCKLAYADEWASSIAESHPASAETEAALQQHQREVQTISKALSRFQPHLQQLLDAAGIVACAAAAQAAAGTAAADEAASGADLPAGSVVAAAGTWHHRDGDQLQSACDLLRRVAAAVTWF